MLWTKTYDIDCALTNLNQLKIKTLNCEVFCSSEECLRVLLLSFTTGFLDLLFWLFPSMPKICLSVFRHI